MNKATIGLLVTLGVWVVGAVALRQETRKVACDLEVEMNRILSTELPDFKGNIKVETTASFSYKVKITLYREDGTVLGTKETEHSRYLGWFQASTWLAGKINYIKTQNVAGRAA